MANNGKSVNVLKTDSKMVDNIDKGVIADLVAGGLAVQPEEKVPAAPDAALAVEQPIKLALSLNSPADVKVARIESARLLALATEKEAEMLAQIKPLREQAAHLDAQIKAFMAAFLSECGMDAPKLVAPSNNVVRVTVGDALGADRKRAQSEACETCGLEAGKRHTVEGLSKRACSLYQVINGKAMRVGG